MLYMFKNKRAIKILIILEIWKVLLISLSSIKGSFNINVLTKIHICILKLIEALIVFPVVNQFKKKHKKFKKLSFNHGLLTLYLLFSNFC